ncbi:MAG: hypothetical protein ACPL1G_07435 [Thermodesulfovibrionales bacterium]
MAENGNKKDKKRKKILVFLLSFLLLLFAGLYFLIQSPIFINFLGSVIGARLGYKINLRSISFSPKLEGAISDLEIKRLKDGGLDFFSPHIDFKGKIRMPFKGEVEKITMTQPKLKFRYEKKKKLDLSFIKKLPDIHLLSIKRGEFDLSFAKSSQIIRISDINLEIRDFSPEKGGRMTLDGNLKILSNNYDGMKGDGNIKAQFKFSKIFPEPVGEGFLDLVIDSGLYKSSSFKNLVVRFPVNFNKEKIDINSLSLILDSLLFKRDGRETGLRDLKLQASIKYDLKTGIIDSNVIEGRVSNLGILKGSVKGTLRSDFPWNASFKVSVINFENIYSIFRPFLPLEYRKWFVKGSGVIDTYIKGNYAMRRFSWDGEMILHFKQGEFGSPDGTKAGQGIEGEVILRIRSPTAERKIDFELSSEAGGGEVLWGRYYKDLSGEKIRLNSLGSFFLNASPHLEFQSSLDLFKTGEYNLSGIIQKNETVIDLKAQKISHNKVLSIFKDYLSQDLPSFSNIQSDGNSQIEMRILRKDGKLSVKGVFEIKDASIDIPDKSLSINGLNLMLPFDLFYPPSLEISESRSKSKTGYLIIEKFEKGKIRLEGLSIPLVLSQNNLFILEEIHLSLLGGKINISNFQGRDIISSSRQFSFSLGIQDMDINFLGENLMGMNLAGLLKADFTEIRYQYGTLYSQGKTSAKIFGGDIEATNILVKDIFSKARKIRGDIIFKDIDLEKVTENIKIGKMTGIIEGSIKNLEIEYGQPSRFILDIDSVKKSGVQQKISMDAVESISILGTGSEGIGRILKSGIRSFFKEYPYSRIGIRCTLENDKFSIRGKIHSGGTEYLVRKSFLRGIDVVNQNPDNIISFKDMQERIKRIFRVKDERKS